jgi:hypothetical protein
LFNLKMLAPQVVGEEEVQWAERQFGVVMEWVTGTAAVELRPTQEPQCLTPCCVLMMIAAGTNPKLAAVMRRARRLPPVWARDI